MAIEHAIERPLLQAGLAVANIVGSALLWRESKGEKPIYGMAAGTLLIFGSYHIYMAIELYRRERQQV